MSNEREVAIEKLQNALLKLPKNDLIKLLKNTYQAMRIKHGIPAEKKGVMGSESLNGLNFNKVKRGSKLVMQSEKAVGLAKNVSGQNVKSKGGVGGVNKGNLSKMNGHKGNGGKEVERGRSREEVEEAETDDEESEGEVCKTGLKEDEVGKMNLKGGGGSVDEQGKDEEENLIEKYLDFDECVEQLTFRSQVEIPQLDLKQVQEYMDKKNKCVADEKEKEVLTPKFPKGGVGNNSCKNNSGGSMYGGNNAGYNSCDKVNVNYVNYCNNGMMVNKSVLMNRYGQPMYNLVPLNTNQPIFYPQTQMRMTKAPFYARSRSLQRF